MNELVTAFGFTFKPSSGTPVPRGWAEQYVLPAVGEIDETVALWGDGTLLQGMIATHKAQGHDVQELQSGKLFVEIRIGELLGPAERGGNGSNQHQRSKVRCADLADAADITKQIKSDLRRLAWYRLMQLRLLT